MMPRNRFLALLLAPSWQAPSGLYGAVTLVEAAVAASATALTLAVNLPSWAMFLGWVGYCTSGRTTRDGAVNLLSFLIGLGMGLATGSLIEQLTPWIGPSATPLAIFAEVALVLSLRSFPPIDNPRGYFLGSTSFFASAQSPSIVIFAALAIAGTIGAIGAGLSRSIQNHLARVAVGKPHGE